MLVVVSPWLAAAWRGEAATVLSKAIKLCLSVWRVSIASQIMSRFTCGWIPVRGQLLLTNPHLPNFLKRATCTKAQETVCVPGLNCFLPGTSGACPIGGVSAVVGSSKFSFSYYITGFCSASAWTLYLRFSCAPSAGFRNCCINSTKVLHKESSSPCDTSSTPCVGDGFSCCRRSL